MTVAARLLLFVLGNFGALVALGIGSNVLAAFSKSLLIASRSPSTLYSCSARLLTLNSFCWLLSDLLFGIDLVEL